MKFALLISFVILITLISGCSTKNDSAGTTANTVNSTAQAKTPESKLSQRSIEFQVSDNQQIKAQITESSNVASKTAIFSPSIKMTGGNLYTVASTLLREFYGEERGAIQPGGKKTKNFNNADYLCWEIANPAQDFCILPFPDAAASNKMTAVTFIVK